MVNLNDIWGDEGTPTPEETPAAPPAEQHTEPTAEDQDEPEEEEEGEEEGSESAPSPVQFLLKAGILTEDPGDVDEDTLAELIEQEHQTVIDEIVQSTFDEWSEKLPEQVLSLIKFTFNGGTADEFFKAVNEVPLGAFDTSTETGQEIFLRYYYKSVEGLDEDELESKIEWLIEKGKLGDTSTKAYKKLAKDRDTKLENMAAQKLKEAQDAKERQRKEQEQLRSSLSKITKIWDYEIPAGERKIMERYITQPVADGGVTFKSGLIADLYKIFDNPESLLKLGKLVKAELDPSFLTKSAETKVTRKIKEKLNNKPTPKDGDGTIWD